MDDWQLTPSSNTVIVIVVIVLVIIGIIILIVALVHTSQNSNSDPPSSGTGASQNNQDNEDNDDFDDGPVVGGHHPHSVDDEARDANLASVEEFVVPGSGSDLGIASPSGHNHGVDGSLVGSNSFGSARPNFAEDIILGSDNPSPKSGMHVEEVTLDLDDLAEPVQWDASQHAIQLPPPPVSPIRPVSLVKLAPPPDPIVVLTQPVRASHIINNPIITVLEQNGSSESAAPPSASAPNPSIVSTAKGPSDSIPDASELTSSELESAAAHEAAKNVPLVEAAKTKDTPLIEAMQKSQNQDHIAVPDVKAVESPKPAEPAKVAEVKIPTDLYGPAASASKGNVDETSGQSVGASMTNPASLSSDFSSATDKSGRTQPKRQNRNPISGLVGLAQASRPRGRGTQ